MDILNYTSDTIKNLFSLKGKTAIVTGGGGSLGKSIALGYAEFGCNLVLTGRTQATLDAAVKEVEALGVKAIAVTGDTMKEEDCARIVAEAEKAFGKIDILLPAAGIARRYPAEEFPAETFAEVINTNVTGTFLICKAVANHMIKNGGGKIITVSSVRANNGHPLGYGAYAASKGAINSLTRQLASEWAKYDINVNSIAPTVVSTELTAEIFADPEKSKIFTDRILFHRPAVSEELIGTAVYLAAHASDFITGQIIYVDGGAVAG